MNTKINKSIGIIGGGIIGLAIAYKIQLKFPSYKITVLEKEPSIGNHQSGRNSGVLHCGLAYKPGSLKAKLAIDGISQMTNFCINHNVSHDICGKIVVANTNREIKFIENLRKRGCENGLEGLRFLSKDELKIREPFVNARKALLVPNEGIVDYRQVMQKLKLIIKKNGGRIICNSKVLKANYKRNKIIIYSIGSNYSFDNIINTSGLHSDRMYTLLTGKICPIKIIPFRGEYFKLKPEYNKLINNLIYPAPDPNFPFLGVHCHRMINGARELGPNAVIAFKREGYKLHQFSLRDFLESILFIGLWKFVIKNFTFSLNELLSSMSMFIYIKKINKLVPKINSSMLEKGSSGVRAQAMDEKGNLIMDFRILKEKNQIHVLNAPSPGATSCFSIADYVIEKYL